MFASHTYYIFTDSTSCDDIEAADVADALDQFGCPESVRSIRQFEAWLERVGGYGQIQEDGVIVAKVS